jgi:hypothetical protein
MQLTEVTKHQIKDSPLLSLKDKENNMFKNKKMKKAKIRHPQVSDYYIMDSIIRGY